ncbi:pyridoxal-phosphate dependent enzyme, partial [Listeria monocytogenes]|uniref:pyridoxal-phosphate dependent enzyme n=1 Tax=Listeria monocytogenes TaxID=1639 RepID=UPI000D9F9A37
FVSAVLSGAFKPGVTFIVPSCGNTGIGLALVAAALGYQAFFVMPETMSFVRRYLLQAFGAIFVLTPGPDGMFGAFAIAEE